MTWAVDAGETNQTGRPVVNNCSLHRTNGKGKSVSTHCPSAKMVVRDRCVMQAAARHHCSYLVHSQTTEFLRVGGDSRWLNGLQYAPKKLANLCQVNKILAHRPWLLDRQHVEVCSDGLHLFLLDV